MKVRVELSHGPVNFEVEADDGDEYEDEVLNVLSFIEENEDKFQVLAGASRSSNPAGNGKGVDSVMKTNGAEFDVGDQESALVPVAEDLRIEAGKLEEIMDVDPEGGRHPILFLDDTEILGDLKVDRQRGASLILLYLWKVCYDEEKVSSSDLKEALEDSDVSSANMFHMYDDAGKKYFDPTGTGASASVKIRRPGLRQAREEIKDLVDMLAEA